MFPALQSRPWLVSWPVGVNGMCGPPVCVLSCSAPCALWVAESRDASDRPLTAVREENHMTEMQDRLMPEQLSVDFGAAAGPGEAQ